MCELSFLIVQNLKINKFIKKHIYHVKRNKYNMPRKKIVGIKRENEIQCAQIHTHTIII